MEGNASREVLGSALERDDRKVSPLRLEMNRQTEADSGLASDENLRRRAPRSSGPSAAGFEARRPAGDAPMVVDLIRSGGAEPSVRPVAVVPGEIERQLLLEGCETERHQN